MIKQRDILILLWLTFITVVAWIGFNLYHVMVTSTISEDLQLQITPINPNFDLNTISRLKSREQVDPLYQFNNNPEEAASLSATPAISPSPVGTTVPVSTGSASIGIIPSTITPTAKIAPFVTGAP